MTEVENAIAAIRKIQNENTVSFIRKHTLDMAIEALEKQVPKKVDDNDDPIETRFYLFTCPTCDYHLSEGMRYYKAYDYCPHCGQALDWPEVGG